jgi:hypothetical protein
MKLQEIVTKQDLSEFKTELIEEMKALFQTSKPAEKLLKSKDVKKILSCVDSTLQYYRQSGKLPHLKIGGTYYYPQDGIERILNSSN